MKIKRVVDKDFLNSFRWWVRKYNNQLEMEGLPDQIIIEDFYEKILEAIYMIKQSFAELTVSKEIAREEFDPDKLTDEFIKMLQGKAKVENGQMVPETWRRSIAS